MTPAIVAIITALGGIAVAWLETRRRRDHRENQEAMQGVSYQITNAHGTHLRDDLDEVRDDVKDLVFIVKDVLVPEVRSIREHQLATDQRQAETDRRLNAHLANS